MKKIRIPEEVKTGFNAISKLDASQISLLCNYLDKMPIMAENKEIIEYFEKYIDKDNGRDIFFAILSFAHLSDSEGVNLEELAFSLTESYQHLWANNITEEDKKSLTTNLAEIFNHLDKIQIRRNAKDLLYDEGLILTNSQIITDIRLLSNESSTKDSNNSAILVHHLHLFCQKNEGDKEKVIVALDISDLKTLKKNIESALERIKQISENYGSSINFLNIIENENNG